MKVSSKFIYTFGALGGLLFGYDTGVISGAILFIQKQLHLSSWTEGIVVSAVLFGAIFGAAVISPLSDKLGRRKMVLTSAAIFFLGSLGSAFATSTGFLIAARVILGIAVGGASALVPMYLSEVAPAKARGSLSGLNQLMIMTGILLAYVVNFIFSGSVIGWRLMLGFAAIPAAILFIGTLLLPESPRFLVREGRIAEAKAVLAQIRTTDEAKAELAEMQDQFATTKMGTFKDLFTKFARPALTIGIGLAILQQIMGCNTVLYYAPTIFKNVGLGSSAALIGTIGIGIANVIITAIAVSAMDKFGRKTLLTFGGIGMAVSLAALAVLVHFSAGSAVMGWLTVLFLAIYIMFFCATWGPILWIMIGEIFPLAIRGLGVGISSVINWIANLGVALFFPSLLAKFGIGDLFAAFAIICVVAIVFVHAKVFETRGKSLEEIEGHLHKLAGDTPAKAVTGLNTNLANIAK